MLRWTFRQHQAAREGLSNLDRLELPVPTRGGWIPASQATFSSGWPGTRGSELQRLLSLTQDASSDLKALAGSLLLNPSDWPFAVEDPQQWVQFLGALGVRDGLWPRRVATPPQHRHGSAYGPQALVDRVELPGDVAQRWMQDVRRSWSGDVLHPQTTYHSSDDLWVLPGQDVIETLGAEARDEYALLVLMSLDAWPPGALTYTFQLPHGHRSGSDQQRWPTPVATFLRTARWFPMMTPGRSEDLSFVAPPDGWHFTGAQGEAAPRFAPLCPRRHRRLLDASPRATARLRSHGLPLWDAPESAAKRLRTLGTLVQGEEVRPADVALVRKACREAWAHIAQGAAPPTSPLPVVVSTGPSLTAVEGPGATGAVYVPDDTSDLVTLILDSARFPLLIVNPREGARAAQVIEGLGVTVRRTSAVDADVLVDGIRLDPGEDPGIALVDDLAEWLPRFVAAALELSSNPLVQVTPSTLQTALARLRRIRLVAATAISVCVDEHTLDVGELGRDGLHVAHSTTPTIAVLREEPLDEFSWRDLAAITDHLSQLIGQAPSADTFRASAFALDHELDGRWTAPTEEQVALALGATPERVREVWLSLSGHLDRLMRFVVVEVAWHVGHELASALEEQDVSSREDLVEHLQRILPPEVEPPSILHRAERVSSFDELRNAMGADLGTFNTVLRRLGRDPIHYVDRHRAAFRNYVEHHRDDILDRLRQAHLADFRAGHDLSGYTTSRDLGGLGPDSAWLDEHEEPPVSFMQIRVDEWLTVQGATDERSVSLPALTEVRETNTQRVERFLDEARPMVAAWMLRHSGEAVTNLSSSGEVVTLLHSTGVLDFEHLDEASLFHRLTALGLWPAEMPHSLDLTTLGLPEDALTHGLVEARRAKEERDRERRRIVLGGQAFDASEDGYRQIAQEVVDELAETGAAWPKRLTPLTRVPARRRGGTATGVGRGKGRRVTQTLSDSQRAAIGLVGEVVAHHWLCANFPDANDSSWVSGYRQFVLGGDEGDDTLGYDFVVHQKTRKLLFEVKATPGEAAEFEMGTSELRTARAAAKGTYRLLFVRYALEPNLRKLLVLPNPLEPANKPYFSQTNQGVRLAFDPGK